MKSQPTADFPSNKEILDWYQNQRFGGSGLVGDYLVQTPTLNPQELKMTATSEGTIIDVRSPHEYELDHLPHAVNVPLLNNLERHIVGTLYKNIDSKAATRVAHHFFKQKEIAFMEKINTLSKPYFIYCWRGGGRSRFISSHLHSQGHVTFRIDGGYKAYRTYLKKFYEELSMNTPSLLILAGLTGSGKTQLLQAAASFWPTIDLERAAQHCGSVFGHIPYKTSSDKAAVPQSRFESHIFSKLSESVHSMQPILVEDEGRRIGRNHLPASLHQIIRESPRIWIQLPLQSRIQNIIDEYFSGDNASQTELLMMTALDRLHKFIGKEARENLKQSLVQKDYESFVHYLLTNHYDARYRSHPPHIIHTIEANGIDEAKGLLIQWLKQLPLPFSYKKP